MHFAYDSGKPPAACKHASSAPCCNFYYHISIVLKSNSNMFQYTKNMRFLVDSQARQHFFADGT